MNGNLKFYDEPEIKVILFGVGAIGCEVSRLLLKKEGVKIIGAIDADPNKAGRDLGELMGLESRLGTTVSKDISGLSGVKADIVIHATTSFLKRAYPQIADLIRHGLNVISTCEELSYPHVVSEGIAREIDELAKKYGVTVLGTGINPGFLMDTLVITLTSVCQDIESIRVERIIDASRRRLAFQKKIGAGLRIEEFEKKNNSGEITGHIGLKQSIGMIADALGWKLERIEEEPVEPIIAKEKVGSNFIVVEPGSVAGLVQKAHGFMHNKPVITLTFKAYIGAEDEYDSIVINGTPPIYERIKPCVHGDKGTAAIIVNLIPKVINAPPGLKTMKDLRVPSAVLGDLRYYVKGKK